MNQVLAMVVHKTRAAVWNGSGEMGGLDGVVECGFGWTCGMDGVVGVCIRLPWVDGPIGCTLWCARVVVLSR
jgi:hypothetical protein